MYSTAPGDQLQIEASALVQGADWRINLMYIF